MSRARKRSPASTLVCPEEYPPTLASAEEIATYMASTATDYVSDEMVEEYFHGCRATLRAVAIETLREGPADGNVRNYSKERQYRDLPTLTMPPIVVDDSVIMDGHHRYRVALGQRRSTLWAYVVEASDDAS